METHARDHTQPPTAAAEPPPASPRPPAEADQLGNLLRRIGDDLRTIARDELELVRGEVQHAAHRAGAELALGMFFGFVAMVGLGLFCVAAVAALAPVIASLALRLVIVGAVYLVLGLGVIAVVASRLRRNASPDLKVAVFEARHTLAGARASIQPP